MAKDNEISFASAVKVADRVEFQSVKLLACKCKQKPKRPAGPKAFDIKRTSRFQIDKKNNIVVVFVQFGLKAFGKGIEQKKKNSFLDIEATYVLLYSIVSLDGLDEVEFNSFAELNGTYNAWPYWREFVQSITSRMELPTLTIPVFRISKQPSKTGTKEKETLVKN